MLRHMGDKAERTRLRLLEAAEAVFARRGYTSATVDEIAEEAGMSIGAFYSRLGSKEDTFVAVFERYLDRRREEIELLAGGSALDPSAAAGAWINLVEARGPQLLLFVEFWLYATRSSVPAANRMSVALKAFDESIEQTLATKLERGSRTPTNALRTARSLVAMYRGYAMSHALGSRGDSVSLLSASTRDLLAGGDR